jgi:hypothetical protein
MENSFVSGNTANGGFVENGRGGGIYNEKGDVRIVSSTVAGNTAAQNSGGIFNAMGHVSITNSTIVKNSARRSGLSPTTVAGGIRNLAQLELQNSIVALNTADSSPDCSGSASSLGNNIIGDTAGCSIVLTPSDLRTNPLLGDLINDGATGHGRYPLLPGSPAINAANACPSSDQLGTPRNGICDIGSVEFYAVKNDSFIVASLTTAYDPRRGPGAPAGVFRLTATFTNISNQSLLNGFADVSTLTGGNLLLNANGGAGGVGARLTLIPPGTPLQPGASRSIEFVIGLQQAQPFTFLVNLLGRSCARYPRWESTPKSMIYSVF